MPITIIAPKAVIPQYQALQNDSSDSGSDSDSGGVDLEGDVRMRPAKRARHNHDYDIVTPGEVITSDSQWMRWESSFYSTWRREAELI
jgi:exosome complex component RRP4